jgi:hypothetical protein
MLTEDGDNQLYTAPLMVNNFGHDQPVIEKDSYWDYMMTFLNEH